ncbi:MAG: MlaD family protein [Longimicrobiales bacterium]
MRESARNVLLGTTTLVAAIGLITMLMLFGELDRLIKPSYLLTINTDNAAGLRAGSTIELNGVPIGIVDGIVTTPDPRYAVRILALITMSQRIPADVIPHATTSLLGGSATLQLESIPSPLLAYLPTDGTAQINGTIGSRLVEQIRTELENYVAPLVELAGNLNELVRARDPGEPQRAAASIRTALENLNTALEQLAELPASLETQISELTGAALPALDELTAQIQELRTLTRLATEGKGTIAQLLNNPDLYVSLTDSVRQLERALIEMELLVQEIRGEGFKLDGVF